MFRSGLSFDDSPGLFHVSMVEQCCVFVSSIVHALEDSNGFARNGNVSLLMLITMSCLVLDSLSC